MCRVLFLFFRPFINLSLLWIYKNTHPDLTQAIKKFYSVRTYSLNKKKNGLDGNLSTMHLSKRRRRRLKGRIMTNIYYKWVEREVMEMSHSASALHLLSSQKHSAYMSAQIMHGQVWRIRIIELITGLIFLVFAVCGCAACVHRVWWTQSFIWNDK